MPKVRICVEIGEEAFQSFRSEAEREGLTLESLLEKTVNNLLEELERERTEGLDSPIIPA